MSSPFRAELAIKEFLVAKRPEIEALVIELQSPRLGVLYGSVLKAITGQESPKNKELDQGATRRNRLVHRPEDNRPDAGEAFTYVVNVEIAIYHLLTLLFPDDEMISRTFRDLPPVVPVEGADYTS